MGAFYLCSQAFQLLSQIPLLKEKDFEPCFLLPRRRAENKGHLWRGNGIRAGLELEVVKPLPTRGLNESRH